MNLKKRRILKSLLRNLIINTCLPISKIKKNQTTSDIVDEQMAVISLGYEYYTRTWPTQKMKEVGKDTFQIIDSEESIFAKKAKLVFNRNQDGEISSISFTSKNDETFTSIRSVKLKK